MHHELPETLDLAWYRKQAKSLVRAVAGGDEEARARVREALGSRERFALSDAQHVLAVEHGFRNWADFRRWIETRAPEPRVGRIGRTPIPVYEARAQTLVAEVARGDDGALRRVRAPLPRSGGGEITLLDAKVVVAREVGFPTWRDLVRYQQKAIDTYEERPHGRLAQAWELLQAEDVDGLRVLLEREPELVRERYPGAGSTLLEALTQPENAQLTLRLADLLIEYGSELDVPLNLAACFNRAALVERLLAAGARCDATEIWGITPLQTAVYHGAREAADLLAPVALVPDALYVAAGAGRLDALSGRFDEEGRLRPEALRLRPNLADVGWPPAPPPRDDSGETLGEAMALAAFSGRIEAMELLLERGADPSGAVHLGVAGLHLAALAGRVETARWLVEHGADPTARDEIHRGTPLGWAEHNRPGSPVHEYLASLGAL